MVLPITKSPAKILRTATKAVNFPLNKEMKRLLKDMLDTVKRAEGIGLAAPQVSSNLNLALIYLAEAGGPTFFLFNPKIVKSSKKTVDIEEGCLSAPGVFGMVERPEKITVEAQDLDGKKITITDDGWVARVMQHEIDHLNKTLILDKLKTVTRGENLISDYAPTMGKKK